MLNRYAQSDSLVKNKEFKLTFSFAAKKNLNWTCFDLGSFLSKPKRSEVWYIIASLRRGYHQGYCPCISSRRSRVLSYPLRFDDIQFFRIDDIHDFIVMISTHSRDNLDRLILILLALYVIIVTWKTIFWNTLKYLLLISPNYV